MYKKCAVFDTSSFIGKKWTLSILLEVYKGENNTKRYSAIKKKLPGITPKILSKRLSELKEEGLLKQRIDNSSFPKISEYSLTKSGKDFIKILKEIKKWTLKWSNKYTDCKNRDCRHCEF